MGNTRTTLTNSNIFDIDTACSFLKHHRNRPLTIEYRDGMCCLRNSPANPDHARIYYELKEYGEKYVNALYMIGACMLHECKEAAKLPSATATIVPFPGASRFAAGGG